MKVRLLATGDHYGLSRHVGSPIRSWNRRLWMAGYVIFAAILFVAFVSISFPYTDTISALLAPMGVKVVSARQAMNFPIGARLENVRLISGATDQLLLQISEL